MPLNLATTRDTRNNNQDIHNNLDIPNNNQDSNNRFHPCNKVDIPNNRPGLGSVQVLQPGARDSLKI